MGDPTGWGVVKGEGPDPVVPTPGKVNVGFVVEVLVVVAGVGRLVCNGNVSAGFVVVLEAAVVGGAGAAGLEKKLGTVVTVMEGSGFVVWAGKVVAAGFAKKFGTPG